MMEMKKLILTITIMLLPLISGATGVEVNGIFYNLESSNNTAIVTINPNKYTGNIVIPEVIDYNGNPYSVVSVGAKAFMDCTELHSVEIPNTVTILDDYAFYRCSGLKTISIGNSVEDIKESAFALCTSLSTISLPNSVRNLGHDAFAACGNLKSIILNEGLKTISGGVFYMNQKLESIDIPNSVESIGYMAFSFCGISSANIPTSLTYIESRSFDNCYNLNEIEIPYGVTGIGIMAFYKCTHLISIIIPYTVNNIGGNCFAGCENLKDVYCYNDKVPTTITKNAFDGWISSATLHVPEIAIDDYKNAENWKNFSSFVPLPNYLLKYIVDGTIYKIFKNEENKPITPEVEPTKEGYTFSGWSEIPETMPAKDVTITGTFSVNKYKLTYQVDGTEYKTHEIEYGTAISPETEPTKEGYTFSGWSEIPETMPAKDVTVTGTFIVNKYKLTYQVDGTEYKTYEVEYGKAITPETAPTKEGYTFSGWSKIPETMPAKDVEVTGTFTINKYKLTYKVDGADYKSYEIEYGSAITPEAELTKEGYTFSGWNEIPETMPAKDITITGTFTINKYKLTYMVDGEEYKTYEVEYDANITPEDEPMKEGYAFSGWSEIPEKMPAEDIEITGTFEVNTYKLTYMVDDEEYLSYEIEYGTEISPEEEPTKEGYTFSGWSEIPETMPAEDIEITGTFEVNTYKLTYMVDDEEYLSYEIEYGAEITPEDEPTKEGYTFSGWSEIPETMPSEDVTITGTFTKGSFKIIYLVDGEVYKTIGYDYGDTISPEDEPTKDGYTFSGWSDIPETMPAEDIEVTGTFEINTYKLTYMVDGEEYKSYEIKYGADITAEEEPTKEGYTFSGWSEIPSTMPADDITITGTFTINQYKLTYEVDGEEYKVLEIEYAATITPEVEPTKEGYTFSGWSEIPKTMPAEDVTVTGTFTVNSYKLTYMIGNDIYKVVVYEYGATIIPESQPEGDYANFEWVGLPETMPAKDVTVYANYETGIMGVEMLQDIQAIYTPNGKKLDKPQKGLNIIRTKDGKVNKVVIK